MVRQIILDGWERLINPSINPKILRTGTNQDLFSLQAVIMSTVLNKTILNKYRIGLIFWRL